MPSQKSSIKPDASHRALRNTPSQEEISGDREQSVTKQTTDAGIGIPLPEQAGPMMDPRMQAVQRQRIFQRIHQKVGNSQAQRSLVQRSPLSDRLTALWDPANKGPYFDALRALSASERADADLVSFVNNNSRLGPDDRWLSQRILQHGPEPLWPASDIQERQRRASANQWAPEMGGMSATLSATNQGVTANTEAFFFPGMSPERALIIGGMHGSEMSAVQVAEQLVNNLRSGNGPRPFFTVIIVPRLFAANVAQAEREAAANPSSVNSPANTGRYSGQNPTTTDPNRQFPTAGTAFDANNPVDAEGRQIEPANIILLELIQRFQPSRVANLHSIRTAGSAGIYADPRTNAQGQALGFGFDRDLALAMSDRAKQGGARVRGNRRGRGSRDVRAVYPLDPAAAAAGAQQARSSGGSQAYGKGTSFGTWGTTEVNDPNNPQFNRPAMTVITVEVATAHRTQDVAKTQQAARQAELEAHTATLQEIFLGEPGTGTRPAQTP